ncbi:Imm1 family immunity protein [Streptomyces virginiae]|uniref:Imm1 family immunity protein n=1 Tax=Streptomyces virginiae TaxID=1961 RepID=UPI0035E2F31F
MQRASFDAPQVAPRMKPSFEEFNLILNIFTNGQAYYAAEWSTTRKVLDELFGSFQEVEEYDAIPASPRLTAGFTLSRNQENGIEAAQRFDSYLHVAVNNQTGYGALKWMLPPNSAVSVDTNIAEYVWISNNPTPPDDDPYVISDPDLGRCHDRLSTLPISVIRDVVEDFCRAGNGKRPSRIDWTPGDLSGKRHDSLRPEITAAHCDDPWCEIAADHLQH